MINKTDWRVFNIIFQLQKKENQDLENEHLLEKYQENNVDIAESITNILKFVGNLRKIIESSKVQDRRSIFGILLSNSVILDKKCLFSLAKPFCEICRNQEKVIGWSVRIVIPTHYVRGPLSLRCRSVTNQTTSLWWSNAENTPKPKIKPAKAG